VRSELAQGPDEEVEARLVLRTASEWALEPHRVVGVGEKVAQGERGRVVAQHAQADGARAAHHRVDRAAGA
jgi:hypothetical protein